MKAEKESLVDHLIFASVFIFCYVKVFPFQINPRNIEPFYKVDLDFWGCIIEENPVF